MKQAQKPQKSQKNQILLIQKIKIPLIKNGAKEFVQKVIKIDLNGAQLYKYSSAYNSSLSKQNNQNSLESVEVPQSSFPILPETEVYQINANDDGLNAYLKQISAGKQKSEWACFYCNAREGSMFPIIFQSQSACIRFHQAVLIYKLYHRHLAGFKQVCQKNNLSLSMNMRLLESLAKSLVTQNIVIDPEDLSVIEMQQFELEVMKDAIEQFITKSNAQSRLSSNSGSRYSSSNLVTLFNLQLRYKLVDQTSLSYLPQIISPELLYKNMKQFDIARCGVNDQILRIMLKQEEKGNFVLRTTLLYENLMKLDLSYNQLTDMSFLTLSVFFAYTPKLSDLCLSGNLIKLESILQIKKQEKQNARMSKIRLSTGFASGLLGKNEPPFIQFLLSLQYLPLNYLNLDNNLIQDPEILVNYIIEGENVPIRYLSIKNNRVSEVDKIRMAKLIISEVRERKDGGPMVVVDFGYISVVDEQVYQYFMLLKDKSSQLGLESLQRSVNESRRSTKQIASLSVLDLKKFEGNQPNSVKVSLTLNKEWQLCDQQGILQVSNLYKSRRKTSLRRSQIVNNILMNSSLSPSNSSSNLKKEDKVAEIDHISAETFKPTVQELNKAYIANNYSAVHLYKQLLQDYNIELYNKKVAPLFATYEHQLKNEQKKILMRLDQFVNFETAGLQQNLQQSGGLEFYQKLDPLISKLFMLRFENEVKQSIVLYEGSDDEVEISGYFCWNVFTYLLYLKHRCDELIEKMIINQQNPMQEISQKLKNCNDLYTQYYLRCHDELCEDNYQQILNQLIKQRSQMKEGKTKIEAKQDISPVPKRRVQKEINQLIREKYLRKCKTCAEDSNETHSLTQEQRFLCIVEPRLMFTGYLIRYYCPKYIPSERRKRKDMLSTVKCKLQVNTLKIGQPISKNITNFLSFISTYDMLAAPPLCINPTIPPAELVTFESLKLSVYNPAFESSLLKFSSIVIAFLKFLHHSPHKVVPQTLQYLNYLINTILSEEDSYNVECLSTQFYIQLFTYNAELDVEARAKQIDPSILLTLVQFTSLYMPHSQMLEEFIIAHLLRAEMALNKSTKLSCCRMLRHDQPRYLRKQDQLPPEVVTHIFTGPHQTQNWLQVALQINYSDPAQPTDTKLIIHIHLLATIEDLYNQVEKMGLPRKLGMNEEYSYRGQVAEGNKNWGLFLYDLSTQKNHLLLPSSIQKMNVYTLYRTLMISPTSGKKRLHLKRLFMPIPSPLAQFTNELQTRWYFQQIYQAFREYGSYLSMIPIKEQSTHVMQVIVQCMLCHILLEEKDRIEEIVAEGVRKSEATELGEYYCGQLEQYCPKGTAPTLSGQERKYISEELCKGLEAIIGNLRSMEQYYSQILHAQIAQFEQRCQLLTCATAIYSPVSQQELLFTTYGLVRINRTIYVEAVRWQDVYSISAVYDQDEVTIKNVEICSQGDIRIKIAGITGSNQDQIFLNACLILIRNVGLQFLRVGIDRLFKHVSKFGGPTENASSSKQGPISPTISIWQQLNNHIQYSQGPQKQPINLEQINQHHIPQFQHEPVPLSPQVFLKEKPDQKPEEKIIQNEVVDKVQERKPEIEQSLQINAIVQEIEEEAKKKEQSSEENIVVTTSRRSSRRQLPKRRSSRDK